MIPLTPQQLQSIDAESESHPRMIDPRTKTAYVLISEVEYESVREMLEDEHRQRAIDEIASRNAIGRLSESP